MEEKERYIYHEVSNEVEHYECYWDNKESLMFLDYSIQEDDPESVLVDYLENLYETKEEAEQKLAEIKGEK